MISHYRRFERMIRYVAVGAAMAAFYSVVTVALIAGGVVSNPTLASLIGSLGTAPLSFFAHRQATFSDAKRDGTQFVRFLVTAITSSSMNVGLMAASQSLEWPCWVPLALGWICVPAFNYSINAIWVFRTSVSFEIKRGQSKSPATRN